MSKVSLQGKKILVMGLGVHMGGIDLARMLIRHGAMLTITDIKSLKQLRSDLKKTNPSRLPIFDKLISNKSVTLVMGRHRADDFRKQDIIFQNPGIPASSKYLKIATQSGISITNEMAYFLDHTQAHVIGITGTRGKSTVSSLIAHILKNKTSRSKIYLSGNIGSRGITSLLDKAKKNDFVVAEISSFHLEHVHTMPKTLTSAVVTNIYPDHLNRYASMDSYKKAKLNLIKFLMPSNNVVLNFDNKHTREMSVYTKAKKYYFSTSNKVTGVYLKNGFIYFNNGNKSDKVASLESLQTCIQTTLISNILAAIALAKLNKIPNTIISKQLKSYRPLRQRQEIIYKNSNLTIVNDSASTVPIATQKALHENMRNIVLIIGGQDKNVKYDDLVAQIINIPDIEVIVLPGSASKTIVRDFKTYKFRKYVKVNSLSEAVKKSFSKIVKGTTILFSPGAASFNQFANEFDRGNQFNKLVQNALKKKK